MLTIEEVKEVIQKENAIEDFKDVVSGYTCKIGELLFEHIEIERDEGSGDYDGCYAIFKIGEQYFRLFGWYLSEEGCNFDNYMDFHEVKRITKTIEIWGQV